MHWIVETGWTLVVASACALSLVGGCSDGDEESSDGNGGTSGAATDTESEPPSDDTETSTAEASTSEPDPETDTDEAPGGASSSGDEPDEPPAWEGLEGDPSAGEEVFQMTCGSGDCHNATGLGPDLDSYVDSASDGSIATIVFNGISGGCNSGFCPGMPSQDLEAQEFADVLAYLRVTYPSE